MRPLTRQVCYAAALILCACPAQPDITPEQAIEKASLFARVGSNVLEATGPVPDDSPARIWGPYYDVADEAQTICLKVLAADGTIVWLYRARVNDEPVDNVRQPVLSRLEAYHIARAFVEERVHDIDLDRWRFLPEPVVPSRDGSSYWFPWYEVLDAQGVLGEWPIFVKIDGNTGAVTHFERPAPRPRGIYAAPKVSRSDAKRIARRWAAYDPRTVPIRAMWMQTRTDPYGVACVEWHILQRATDDGTPGPVSLLTLDAQTGEVVRRSVPMGRSNDRDLRPPFPSRIAPALRVVTPDRTVVISLLVPPALDGGVLWVRAEHLRAMDGVHVDVDRNGVRVRSGDRTFTGDRLQARRRDGPWWVPLRSAARTLGWSVTWNAARKEATVHTGP